MNIFIEAAKNNLKFFLEKPLFLDQRDENGNSLLHYAVRGSAKEVVYYLLDNHINPNLVNNRGETALFDAVKKGSLEIIIKMIKHYVNLNIENKFGERPLDLAILSGKLNIIVLLIENGADIFSLNKKGESVLFYAVRSGSVEVLEYVLSLSPKLLKTDFKNNTLLHKACEVGSVKITEYLLKLKENPHLKNHLLETPIFLAVRFNHTNILELMIKGGSYLDLFNKYNQDLLALARLSENSIMEEKLLFYLGSKTNYQNSKKNPLRHGVVKKDYEGLKNLVYQGIKDIKDEYQLKAYDYARIFGDKKALAILRKSNKKHGN